MAEFVPHFGLGLKCPVTMLSGATTLVVGIKLFL
jgi:hypothetical protein